MMLGVVNEEGKDGILFPPSNRRAVVLWCRWWYRSSRRTRCSSFCLERLPLVECFRQAGRRAAPTADFDAPKSFNELVELGDHKRTINSFQFGRLTDFAAAAHEDTYSVWLSFVSSHQG